MFVVDSHFSVIKGVAVRLKNLSSHNTVAGVLISI
uniref:Uncharacterized protein n=1 Tax=Arundo donax TaxID=35708 RepID=A0A0A9GAB1_ARUDO